MSFPGSYEPPIARLVSGKPIGKAESLIGYIGTGRSYTFTFPPNVPVRSVGINLMPEFYQKVLPARIARHGDLLPRTLAMLDGGCAIPEVMTAMRQIRSARPLEHIARMYYESKVMEIISLLMQWGANREMFREEDGVPGSDSDALHSVCLHIRRHYAKTLPLNAGYLPK